MNIEKLIEAFAEGDDEIEIHIKRTVDDDDWEEIFCGEDCDECGDDSCTLDDDNEWRVVSKNAKDVREELRDDAKTAHQRLVANQGEEFANNVLALGQIASKLEICISEHIPIRITDALEYNKFVKTVFDEACDETYVNAQYVLIDHSVDKSVKDVKG